MAPFLDPPDLKKQGFRVESVPFSKNRGVRKNTLKTETWLSWNGKRVQSESCKHGKRLTTKTQSINKAFSSSFAGALRAPAQRLGGVSLGTPLARAGATDRLKQRKSLENGSKMPPRRLPNRSQIASKWLPEASRAHPKSGIDNWSLFAALSKRELLVK